MEPTHLGILLVAPALAAAAGCEALNVRIDVVDDMRSLEYHLAPYGGLTVKEGSGRIEGEGPRLLYEARLDAAAMRRLRSVVYKSGFLFEGPPLKASLTRGIFLVVDVRLGMCENRMQVRGARVPSVGRIVYEINKHLPQEHKIPYRWATREEEEYEKYLR